MRRSLRRRRPWEEEGRTRGERRLQNQQENTTKRELLCQLIPEACNDGEVAVSDRHRTESPSHGIVKASPVETLIDNPKVCELIPEICVNNTFVVTSLNQTNSTTHTGNSTVDEPHGTNSTIEGGTSEGDPTRDELLQALLDHPRACALVPELCVNGTLLVNATTLTGNESATAEINNTASNATISMTPSGAPTGDNTSRLDHSAWSAVPSSAPIGHNGGNETKPDGFNGSDDTTFGSRIPSSAPSLQPTRSATPTLSVEPSYSVEPSLSIQPSISQVPSMSIHPSTSSIPTTSSTPSLSLTPSTSSPSSAPSMSPLPTVSNAPSNSISPTNSMPPSLSTIPSLSSTPTISWPSSTPSSHPDVRSCGNWKSSPQQASVEFAYTVQITSLAATFLPDMEELILNSVAEQLLDCNDIHRIAYPDPSSLIGACEPLVATAKSCWIVKSHLQLWTRNAQKAKRDVIQVIRHEFDFGEAVNKVIPNNVFIELQVAAIPPPLPKPALSTGGAIGVAFLCLVVVIVVGAAVKVYRWKVIHSATILQRKDLSPNQAMMDGIFPAVSVSGDEMSEALKSEDDDGTDSSVDSNSSHFEICRHSVSTDDDSIGSFACDSRITPQEFQRKKSSVQYASSIVREPQSVDSFIGNSTQAGPPQLLHKKSSMRYPTSILRSPSAGSISCDSSLAAPLTPPRKKSSMKYPVHVTSNSVAVDESPSIDIPERSLERIDADFLTPRVDEPERSLERIDIEFSNPRIDEPERSLERIDAAFSKPRVDSTVPGERSLTRMNVKSSTPDADRHIDIDFNESFTFRSMRFNRKLSTQSYDTSMASSIIDSDFEDDDDDHEDKPVFSVDIPQYEAVHYHDEDDDASSSEEDRQIDDMRRQLGRQMSARISSFVSADTTTSRSYRTQSFVGSADGRTSSSFVGSVGTRPSSFAGSANTRRTQESVVEGANDENDGEDVDSEAAAMHSLSVDNDKIERTIR